MEHRVSGITSMEVDGQVIRIVGDVTYNDGAPMREAEVGSDGVHGYKETPQVPFAEGRMRDAPDLDVAALKRGSGKTVALNLPNGKTFVIYDAWFAGEGNRGTGEGTIDFKYEGFRAEEIRA